MLCYRDIVVCTGYVNLNLDVNTIQFSLYLIGRIDDFTSEKVCLFTWLRNPRDYAVLPWILVLRGLGGVVVIDAAIGAHGCGSRLAHYFTVAATLDKYLSLSVA